VNPIVI